MRRTNYCPLDYYELQLLSAMNNLLLDYYELQLLSAMNYCLLDYYEQTAIVCYDLLSVGL